MERNNSHNVKRSSANHNKRQTQRYKNDRNQKKSLSLSSDARHMIVHSAGNTSNKIYNIQDPANLNQFSKYLSPRAAEDYMKIHGQNDNLAEDFTSPPPQPRPYVMTGSNADLEVQELFPDTSRHREDNMTSGRPVQRVDQQLARHYHRNSDQGPLEETKTKHAYVDSTAKMLA